MKNTMVISELKHFQIKGNGSPNDKQNCDVYKNGRQQFQVDIIIDAWAGTNGPVLLTESQMRSVELIDYSTGSVVDGCLIRSYEKNVYEFYDASLPQGGETVNQNMSGVTFFVSVPEAANFASMQIAAKITLDGATYQTNSNGSAPGGAIDKGGFNSSLVLTPHPVYVLSARDFQIVKLGGIGYGYLPGSSGGRRYFFRWEITFRDPAFRILSSDIAHDALINWFSQYVRSGDNKDTGHWALPVGDVGQDVHLGALQHGGSTADVFMYPYTMHGAAYAIHEEANWFETHHYVSKHILYIDHNGCGHSVYLVPNNNGTTLELFEYDPYNR